MGKAARCACGARGHCIPGGACRCGLCAVAAGDPGGDRYVDRTHSRRRPAAARLPAGAALSHDRHADPRWYPGGAALRMSAGVVRPGSRAAYAAATRAVTEGQSIGEAMERNGLTTAVAARMLRVG